MTKFPNAPMMRPLNNSCWHVMEQFVCAFKGRIIVINSGFETDGISIPRIAWRLIGHPFYMPILPCALIHDALYATELVTRAQADMIFLELMKKCGVAWWRRNAVWSAVRLCGGIVWARHKTDDVINARKYCTCISARKMVK